MRQRSGSRMRIPKLCSQNMGTGLGVSNEGRKSRLPNVLTKEYRGESRQMLKVTPMWRKSGVQDAIAGPVLEILTCSYYARTWYE